MPILEINWKTASLIKILSFFEMLVSVTWWRNNENSSGDEIANVNFFYDDIVHVQASTYAHWADQFDNCHSSTSCHVVTFCHMKLQCRVFSTTRSANWRKWKPAPVYSVKYVYVFIPHNFTRCALHAIQYFRTSVYMLYSWVIVKTAIIRTLALLELKVECRPMSNLMVRRPAEHVAPSVQRRKVWLTPTTRWRAVTLPRRKTRWNL